MKVAVKPQYVDQIPRVFSGSVRELLATTDERGRLDYYLGRLSLTNLLDRPITTLSGGELQRVALAACFARDADFYFLDEITPYLDVYQRMAAANLVRELAMERPVVIVEHDLAILDMLADTVHIAYGEPAVFGVITHPKGVRVGINQYLEGFLPEENVRFRAYAVAFETRAHTAATNREVLLEFPAMTKRFGRFSLTVEGGRSARGGPGSARGKRYREEHVCRAPGRGDRARHGGDGQKGADILQAASTEGGYGGDGREILRQTRRSLIHPTTSTRSWSRSPSQLLQAPVNTLSGGELQRVAIAVCLSRDADLYILDEPSAHLDVEQRVRISRMIRKHAEAREASTLVIDHDIYVIDMISDRILVFEGNPGVEGRAAGPFDMAPGMNRFLRALGITFRRDKSGRPRINKPGSFLDREQIAAGEYYYTEISK